MIFIALAIAASIAAGVEAERRQGARAGVWARRILTFLLYVVMPIVAFFNMARLEVSADVGVGIVLGWLALLVTALCGWLIGTRLLHRPAPTSGVLAIVGLQANTGLMGLAVVGTILGFDHLSEGVVYDSLVQQPVFFIGSFAIAAATGTKAGETVKERVRAFFVRNPPLIAVGLGLLAPDALAPDVLVDAARVLILSVPVLGFFAVGVTLAEEAEEGALKFPPPLTAPIGAALFLRLVVAPLLLFALAAPLIDLPAAFLLMAAMPAGLHIVVLAHVYGLDVPYAASAIVWTTMVAVPLLLVASVIV
ncbi:MAG: AEC family transporter [Solirubrobacteraceae bacterium]